jgi:hypothetical protein
VTTVSDLTADLLDANPALDAVLKEHLANNDELLSHLFMADITRWLVANGPDRAVLAVLERHLGDGDENVRDVILASFLENLEADDPVYHSVRSALGPTLRTALEGTERYGWFRHDRQMRRRSPGPNVG